MGDPTENATLSFDHFQPHLLKFWKVGADAVLGHEAVVAAIISLTDRGIDTDFSRYSGYDELLDSAILEYGVEVGGKKGAFAGLVDHRLSGARVKFRDDVVASFASDEDAAHWA